MEYAKNRIGALGPTLALEVRRLGRTLGYWFLGFTEIFAAVVLEPVSQLFLGLIAHVSRP